MKRIVELLNEYEKKRIEKINSEGKLFVKLSFRPYTESAFKQNSVCAEIISKYYGFIKWLVDNDKINMEEVPMRCELYYQTRGIPGNVTDDTDILIMLLAIQPKPIEFLISILK